MLNKICLLIAINFYHSCYGFLPIKSFSSRCIFLPSFDWSVVYSLTQKEESMFTCVHPYLFSALVGRSKSLFILTFWCLANWLEFCANSDFDRFGKLHGGLLVLAYQKEKLRTKEKENTSNVKFGVTFVSWKLFFKERVYSLVHDGGVGKIQVLLN